MKQTFITNWNAKRHTNRFEKNNGISQTVQGETRSIKELMLRAIATGQIENNAQGFYIDAKIDDITSMYRNDLDRHDLETLSQHAKSLTKEINQKIDALQQSKELDKLEAKEAQKKAQHKIEASKTEKQPDQTTPSD